MIVYLSEQPQWFNTGRDHGETIGAMANKP